MSDSVAVGMFIFHREEMAIDVQTIMNEINKQA
jgi:hypothetical protein